MKINLNKGAPQKGTPWISGRSSNYESQPIVFQMPDGSRVTMTYNGNNRRVDRE